MNVLIKICLGEYRILGRFAVWRCDYSTGSRSNCFIHLLGHCNSYCTGNYWCSGQLIWEVKEYERICIWNR